MRARVSTWITQRPVFAFYVLAFAITWLGWLPQAAHSHGLFPFDSVLFYILGGIGPGLAAYLVMQALYGSPGATALFSPLWRWRVNAVWYAIALVGNAVIWQVAARLSVQTSSELQLPETWPALLTGFLMVLVAAIPEEAGWRGFALPRLQSRYGALIASLIIGALAILWHLPLLLTKNSVMATYPLVPYFCYLIALSVLYTWLYNNTRGSLLIVIIFHAAANTVGAFFPAVALITGLLAAIVVIAFGPTRLSRRSALELRQAETSIIAAPASKGAR